MATSIRLILVFAILGVSTITLAQESSSAPQSANVTDASSAAPHDESSTTHMASSASGLFGHFAFSNFKWPEFPGANFFSGGSRQKRDTRRPVRCNYRKQGSAMCTSCTSVRRCNQSNRGTDITCGGNTPYCRYGKCSRRKGALCRKSTTTTTTTTTENSGSDSDSSDSTSSGSSATSGTSGSSSSGDSSSSSSTTSGDYDDSSEDY